jgi:hypothetical protein
MDSPAILAQGPMHAFVVNFQKASSDPILRIAIQHTLDLNFNKMAPRTIRPGVDRGITHEYATLNGRKYRQCLFYTSMTF